MLANLSLLGGSTGYGATGVRAAAPAEAELVSVAVAPLPAPVVPGGAAASRLTTPAVGPATVDCRHGAAGLRRRFG